MKKFATRLCDVNRYDPITPKKEASMKDRCEEGGERPEAERSLPRIGAAEAGHQGVGTSGSFACKSCSGVLFPNVRIGFELLHTRCLFSLSFASSADRKYSQL